MTNAFFQFHSANFEQRHVDRSLARKAESALNPTDVRVVGQQPGRPCRNAFRFDTRVVVARLVFDSASGTIGASMLRGRTIAMT